MAEWLQIFIKFLLCYTATMAIYNLHCAISTPPVVFINIMSAV